MRIAYATIAGSDCINWGNRIIEHACNPLLHDYSDHLVTVSAFKPPQDTDFAAVFCPGATIFGQKSFTEWAGRLPKKTPIIIAPSSFMYTSQGAYAKSLVGCNLITAARDPIAKLLLEQQGLSYNLAGCPTLFCTDVTISDRISTGRWIISASRLGIPKDFWKQQYNWSNWTWLIHEDGDLKWGPGKNECEGLQIIYLRDTPPGEVYWGLRSALGIVTGRIHSLLPALGTVPTWYYGDSDEVRVSLLHHLGVRVHSIKELRSGGINFELYNRGNDVFCKLEHAWYTLADQIKETLHVL